MQQSEDDHIAWVNDKGQVFAVSEGETVITAFTKDGSKKAQCTVIVTQADKEETIAPTGIILNTSQMTVALGRKTKLIASVTPEEATNKNVIWKSDDSDIVSVDENGEITAKKVGNTIITVTTADGTYKATCNIVVTDTDKEETPSESDKNDAEDNDTDNNQSTTEDKQTGNNQNANQNTTEDKQTGNQNATQNNQNANQNTTEDKQTGNQNATQNNQNANQDTTQNNQSTGNQNTTQSSSQQTNQVAITSFLLNQTEVTLLSGKETVLTANIQPANADQKITFMNSDASVVSITETGVIKALKPGIAQITAIAADGKTAVCTITVKPSKVTGIKMKKAKNKKVTLSWKKQKGVTGYKVYQYDSKKKKYKLVKTTKNAKIILSQKKNMRNQFKVAAYKKCAGVTLKGAYSKVVK